MTNGKTPVLLTNPRFKNYEFHPGETSKALVLLGHFSRFKAALKPVPAVKRGRRCS